MITDSQIQGPMMNLFTSLLIGNSEWLVNQLKTAIAIKGLEDVDC